MDGYLGQMMVFAGNFAPRNWAYCYGQLVSIADNPSLYSILGITYGGDGVTTFGIPDLRSRVPIGTGSAPGITPYPRGYLGGFERIPLQLNEMPSHNHDASAVFSGGGTLGGSATASMAISSDNNDAEDVGSNAYLGLSEGGSLYSTTHNNTLNPNAISLDLSGLTVDLSGAHVAVTVGNTGHGQAHYNMQPFLAINWIICTNGLYPDRP